MTLQGQGPNGNVAQGTQFIRNESSLILIHKYGFYNSFLDKSIQKGTKKMTTTGTLPAWNKTKFSTIQHLPPKGVD